MFSFNDQYMRIARRVMRDETPLNLTITISNAWILVSALQLATRHPVMGQPLRQHLEHIARQLQAAIVERHPEAEALLEMGWQPEHDQPSPRLGE